MSDRTDYLTVGDVQDALRDMLAEGGVTRDYLVAVSVPRGAPGQRVRMYPARQLLVVDKVTGCPRMFVLTSAKRKEEEA
jgi:hypothetical protein